MVSSQRRMLSIPRRWLALRPLKTSLGGWKSCILILRLKIPAISSACLSALDFSLPPLCATLRSVRMCVKQALSATYAAPEILYHIVGYSSIDPLDRWMLVQLRLWRDSAANPGLHQESDRQSRWAMILKEIDRVDWKLTPLHLCIEDRELPLSRPWSLLRPQILHELKKHSWKRLAERRPRPFGGLEDIDLASHTQLFKSLSVLVPKS